MKLKTMEFASKFIMGFIVGILLSVLLLSLFIETKNKLKKWGIIKK